MAHQYKVGDKVRIKERKGEVCDYPCGFVADMAHQKGKIFTIKEIKELPLGRGDKECKFYNEDNCYYLFKEIAYSWHSSMFEPVLENPEPQTITSLKIGDLVLICDMIGSIQKIDSRSTYYLNFNDTLDLYNSEHYACCNKLRESVPNFEKNCRRI